MVTRHHWGYWQHKRPRRRLLRSATAHAVKSPARSGRRHKELQRRYRHSIQAPTDANPGPTSGSACPIAIWPRPHARQESKLADHARCTRIVESRSFHSSRLPRLAFMDALPGRLDGGARQRSSLFIERLFIDPRHPIQRTARIPAGVNQTNQQTRAPDTHRPHLASHKSRPCGDQPRPFPRPSTVLPATRFLKISSACLASASRSRANSAAAGDNTLRAGSISTNSE